MSRYRNEDESKVYVGGLPADATAEELEEVFNRYGRLRKVWVARKPPGFAFIHFEDVRDAEDATRALDGAKICGIRARVELSTGRRREGGYGGRGGGTSGDRGYGGAGYGYRASDRFDDRGGGRGGGDRGRDDRDRGDRGSRSRRSRTRSRSPRRSHTRSPVRGSGDRAPSADKNGAAGGSRSRSR